jgi:hypothetical protein
MNAIATPAGRPGRRKEENPSAKLAEGFKETTVDDFYRRPRRPYEFCSDPDALEAARYVAEHLSDSRFGAVPWVSDAVAVYVCGFAGQGGSYEAECVAARRAQSQTRLRLAEMGHEAGGHAMVPDGNYGVAWVLLIATPPVVTAGLLASLGQVAGDAWRAYYALDRE